MTRQSMGRIMNPRADRAVSWGGRILIVVVLIAGGLLAAIPFRRPEAPPPNTQRRISSDSVRLVFRNQDITLQMNRTPEKSPAKLPAPKVPATHSHQDKAVRPPELPAQYPSQLDPTSTAPRVSGTTLGGPLQEPVWPSVKLRQHVLVDGDSVARLAERYLGDPRRAGEIVRLNADVLRDPETLPIGKTVVIPAR